MAAQVPRPHGRPISIPAFISKEVDCGVDRVLGQYGLPRGARLRGSCSTMSEVIGTTSGLTGRPCAKAASAIDA